MSGHSHWSTIKRQKGTADSKRGQLFGKLAREIAVVAREGEDPTFNSKLRLAIDKASEANMPKANIERAIGKGAGGGKGESLQEIILEGYGPAGVAIKVFAISDNKNRTVAEIRNLLQRFGGSLGGQGSTAFVFDKEGNSTFTVPVTEKGMAKKVLDLANSLDEHDDVTEVWANFDIPEPFFKE